MTCTQRSAEEHVGRAELHAMTPQGFDDSLNLQVGETFSLFKAIRNEDWFLWTRQGSVHFRQSVTHPGIRIPFYRPFIERIWKLLIQV